MFFKLFLAFTLIPLTELYLLIEVGRVIGGLETIALVVATGAAGAWLARRQGYSTMLAIRKRLNEGLMPGEELIDAFLILVAGVVLLTPGLLTDVVGITLLVPAARGRLKRWLRRKIEQWMREGRIRVSNYP